MITNSRPCSCHGNNPDCFRCNGSGMIVAPKEHSDAYSIAALLPKYMTENERKEYRKSLETAKRKSEKIEKKPKHKKNNVPNPKSVVSCVICFKCFLSTFDFTSHLKSHNRVKCTICNIQIAENRLQKHIKKAHTQKEEKPSVNQVVVFSGIHTPKASHFPESIRCPHCSLLILRDRLRHHLELVHSHTSSETQIKSSRKNSRLNEDTSLFNPPRLQGSTNKDDATYGQHTIRDHGRYGSHPSYDNFDDESKA